MATYRITRNLEASTIDYLNDLFIRGGWKNITVEKTFKRIYGLQMDVNTGAAAVCVRVLGTRINKAEIGTNGIWREATLMIDIFATSDGQREDLKDFILDHIKRGIPYYKYVVVGPETFNKTLAGRLRITGIEDNPVNFNVDKNALQVADRYRHALTVKVCTGQIEE